ARGNFRDMLFTSCPEASRSGAAAGGGGGGGNTSPRAVSTAAACKNAFQSTLMVVKPGEPTQLELHADRDQSFYVISGRARVTQQLEAPGSPVEIGGGGSAPAVYFEAGVYFVVERGTPHLIAAAPPADSAAG